MKHIRHIQGFTLVEVLLTLSIVATCLAMMSSGFQSSLHKQKMLSLTRQIIQELYIARNEAITKRQEISYASTGIWEKHRWVTASQGQRLYIFDKLPAGFRLILRNSLGKNHVITFTPLGFTKSQRSSFYLFGPDEVIRIIVSVSGRIRVEDNEQKN